MYAWQSPKGNPDISHLTHEFLFRRRRGWSPLPDLALLLVALRFSFITGFLLVLIILDCALDYFFVFDHGL